MIAEQFYPKELKEIIADLRAKDDLNEEALARLDRFINETLIKIIIIHLFFFLILLHPKAGFHAGVFIALSFLSMPFLFSYQVKYYVSKLMFLYNFGQFSYGEVREYNSYRGSVGLLCDCSIVGQVTKSSLSKIGKGLIREKYKKGDRVLICYDPVAPERNVPFVPSLAELFYLRKGTPHVA